MAAAAVDRHEARRKRRAALFAIYLRAEVREHLPSGLPMDLASESLHTAVDALTSDDSDEGVHGARLAVAALCRGADALEPAELDSALQRLNLHLDGGTHQALMRICSDVRDRKQRFLAALNLLLGCQLRNYDVIWQRLGNMVTSIEVSVETSRPIDEFKGGLMDPRRWDENLPLVWPKAYLIDGTVLPTDRALDPPRNEAPSVDFAGLFYEEAAWPASFAELGLWRNVLQMKYAETANGVHFDFDEYECLTSRYLGIDSEGGIDCDNGFGDAHKLPDGWTRLTAKKAFRFTKPDLLVVPLNAISSIWLLFLLEAFVLFGACPI